MNDKKTVATIILIRLMAMVEKERRPLILQSYVQKYGPVPNEYDDTVKSMLNGKEE